jgi:hypothetical protein
MTLNCLVQFRRRRREQERWVQSIRDLVSPDSSTLEPEVGIVIK